MEKSLKKIGVIVVAVLVLSAGINIYLSNRPFIDVYFGPSGGFSKQNNQRSFGLLWNKKKATMAEAVHRIFKDIPEKTKIYVAMYSMSDRDAKKDFIDAAIKKDCSIRFLFDGSTWSASGRNSFISNLDASIKDSGKTNVDFVIRYTPHSEFEKYGRSAVLSNGDVIYGSMHEKFGLFFKPGEDTASSGFFGSANLSWSSSTIYAENRFVFRNKPFVSKAFEGRFVHLWNKYGVILYGKDVKLEYENDPDLKAPVGLKLLFNAEGYSLSEIIKNKIINAQTSLDVMLFSFTDRDIADIILDKARKNKDFKIRILLDNSQIIENDHHLSVQGPYLEKMSEKESLTNIHVKYKWRINAYGWNEEDKQAELNHFKILLLHHKSMVVDKNTLFTGSYNWSSSAERRNLEDAVLISGDNKESSKLVNRFLSELDTLWTKQKSREYEVIKRKYSYNVISGQDGRYLRLQIFKIIKNPLARVFRQRVEESQSSGIPYNDYSSITNIPAVSKKRLDKILYQYIKINSLFTNKGRIFMAD